MRWIGIVSERARKSGIQIAPNATLLYLFSTYLVQTKPSIRELVCEVPIPYVPN